MLQQRASLVGENHASGRLQQEAVLLGELLPPPHKNATRSVEEGSLWACPDEVHDRLMDDLSVNRVVLVPNDKIDLQSVHAPVGMGLDRLAHQLEEMAVSNAYQNDRQVA